MKKKIVLFFILMTVLCFGKEVSTISVVGTGTVSGKPDTFSVVAIVETIDKNSEKAVTENVKIINKTLTELEKIGVKGDSIKTENYTLNYRNDYNVKDGEMKYFVRNQISISSKDLEKASLVLTALNSGGVSNIGEIHFYIAERKELEDKAYKLAYEDAKSKATLIAEIDKFKIIPKNINLNNYSPRTIGLKSNFLQSDALPIPVTVPNEMDITATINAEFYMKKK